MFGLFTRGGMGNSKSSDNLLADGTFMGFGCLGLAIAALVVLLLLAAGAVESIMIVRYAQSGFSEAFDREFVQTLKLWSEVKPVIILAILGATIVLSLRYWKDRQPSPIIMYSPGSKPSKIQFETIQPEPEEVEWQVPQIENVQPKQLNAPKNERNKNVHPH